MKKLIYIPIVILLFTFSNCPPPKGYCLWRCEFSYNHFAYTKSEQEAPQLTKDVCEERGLDNNGIEQTHVYYFVECE